MSTSKTANAALGVVAVSTLALAAVAGYKYGYKHEPLPKVVSGRGGVVSWFANPRIKAPAGRRPPCDAASRPIAPPQALRVSTPPPPPATLRRSRWRRPPPA